MNVKIGLEIHQQLDTERKLFSKCPILKSEEFPIEFKRKIRASSGESGNVDLAALYESGKDKTFTYNANSESSDLIDMDEEPPSDMNYDALETVLQACKLLKAEIVDEIQIMRKNVIDGSVVSGFQRTALVGMNGYLKLNKKINISTICIEEDSSVKTKNGFRLDRQGIPLIEIATGPDMTNAEEVKEVAVHIGTLLRSLKVMRGIGTIRQDINISINNGSRVEIKGFQDLKSMTKVINNEIKRQEDLENIKNVLLKRGKSIFEKPFEVTKLFSNTKCNFMKNKKKIIALKLPNFADIFKMECGDRTVGKEVSDYAASYGYGIIHSDEDLKKYSIENEFNEIEKILKADSMDLILVVAGESPEKAIESVLERAKNMLKGVQEETRVVEKTGSKYARPLPGKNRMYPETDIPTIIPDKKIKVPKTLIEKKKLFSKSLTEDMAYNIMKSKYLGLFETLVKKTKLEHSFIAGIITSNLKDLKRKGFDINENDVEEIILEIDKGRIPKSSFMKAFEMKSKGKNIKEIESNLRSMSNKEIEELILMTIKENPNLNESALMGVIMGKSKGKADGNTVSRILRKKLNF